MTKTNPFQTIDTFERFAYLFENIEAEMDLVYESDKAIDTYKERIAKYEATIRTFEKLVLEKDEEVAPFQIELEKARAVVTALEKQIAKIKGEARGHRQNKAHLKRMIAVQESKIRGRQKQLLLIEARKRLNSIGRTIKHNAGRRSKGNSGGIDIVALDAPAVRPFTSPKTVIQNEDPTKQEGCVLRPPDGESPHQPQDPQPGGSPPPGEGGQT